MKYSHAEILCTIHTIHVTKVESSNTWQINVQIKFGYVSMYGDGKLIVSSHIHGINCFDGILFAEIFR